MTENPFWLIERTGFDGKPYPHWYAEKADGWHWWTPVAVDAKRFESKAGVQTFPAYRLIAADPAISITEHTIIAHPTDEIGRLRTTLEFYARGKNYHGDTLIDRGEIARVALASINGGRENG